MTTYFVSSVTGLNTNNGLAWGTAYDTLSTLLTGAGGSSAFAAGDTAFVDDRHNQTQASALTLNFPTNNQTPFFVLCADHTVASPGPGDLKTTGAVSTTGANSITINGSGYFYGLIWTAGSGASTANITAGGQTNLRNIHEASQFILGNTSTSSVLNGPSSGGSALWTNCKVQFGSTSQRMSANSGAFTWKNTASAIMGATFPAILFNNTVGSLLLDGIDLTALTGLIFASGSGSNFFRTTLKDCLLPSSFTTTQTSQTAPDLAIQYNIRSDVSGANNTRVDYSNAGGTVATETTIVRSGGASDGTTSFSRKMTLASNAKVSFPNPLDLQTIAIFNSQTGTRTITVHATSNIAAGGFPNNDDIWIEATYLGNAGNPQASFANNTKATVLSSNTAYTSDGASWAGSPAGGTFAMAVTVTIGQVGYIYVTVKAAKLSTIFYVDPLIVLS